jgi:predicted nucleic acid-binding protein
VIVADTSAIYASIDTDADEHAAAVDLLDNATAAPLISPFVVAEVDCLLSTRFGPVIATRFLEDVANGAYELVDFQSGDIGAAVGVVKRYAELNIGVTDASLVVIAARYGTTELFTLDERHFRAIQPLWGESFTILPRTADTPAGISQNPGQGGASRLSESNRRTHSTARCYADLRRAS